MDLNGLTMEEVKKRQIKYGPNIIKYKKEKKWFKIFKHIKDEPIYILLIISSITYFALGEQTEGMIMIAFVIFVIALDLAQDIRAGNVLRKLKDDSEAKLMLLEMVERRP